MMRLRSSASVSGLVGFSASGCASGSSILTGKK